MTFKTQNYPAVYPFVVTRLSESRPSLDSPLLLQAYPLDFAVFRGVQLLIDLKTNIKKDFSPIIICEATGGYEKHLTQALLKHGFCFHLAHPNKVRSFAKSKGVLAKTDKIDAEILRDYGTLMRPKVTQNLLSESANTIRTLLKRRNQLLSEKHREQARLDKVVPENVMHSIQSHVEWLSNEIKNIEAQAKEASEKKEIKSQMDLLTSVPSVGCHTAFMLILFA